MKYTLAAIVLTFLSTVRVAAAVFGLSRVSAVAAMVSLALPTFVTGIEVGKGVGGLEGSAVIYLGSLVIFVIAAVMGFIGAQTGLSSYLLVKVAFGSGGAAVSCLGHGDVEIIDAVRQQLDKLEFAHTGFFTSEAAESLADVLIENAPAGIDRVYLVSGGSEAIEAAIKLARQYFIEIGQPSKHKVIARLQSYHGNTLGALATGGNSGSPLIDAGGRVVGIHTSGLAVRFDAGSREVVLRPSTGIHWAVRADVLWDLLLADD